jgi:predicted outer membrane protein
MQATTWALALGAACLSAACGARQTRLNDAQIEHIEGLAHSGEVEQAWLATDRAQSDLVKSYAANTIAQRAELHPDEASAARRRTEAANSRTAQEISSETWRTVETLQDSEVTRFDAVYMDAQIRQHAEMKELLDESLIPQAVDPELRERLLVTRATVERQLEEARAIRAGLARAEARAEIAEQRERPR